MKINKLYGCLVIAIMTIVSFLLANNNSLENRANLAMSNIEALHASAGGEMWCDQKNNKECTIDLVDFTGYSTGYLIAIFN